MKASTRFAIPLLAVACAESVPPPASVPCPSAPAPPSTAASAAPATATPPDVDRVEAVVLERLNAKDGAGLFALYGDAMRRAVPIDKTEAFVQGVASGGALTNVGRGRRHAVYALRGQDGEALLELTIDDHGAISGLSLHPRPPEPPLAKNDIPLALPVRGKWYVVWGGDTPETNMHVQVDNAKGTPWSQRRAADIFVKGDDGKTFRGDGKKNEDYLAYGLPIFAVADGEVTTVIDGVHENEPGIQNPTYLAGNEVILRHTPSLYSFYAHLQPGKIKVKVGSKVKRGDLLGVCGNSGNASEPHLHFHLQDGPLFESSWGVLAVFSGVKVTRGSATRVDDTYAFARGDVIESAK